MMPRAGKRKLDEDEGQDIPIRASPRKSSRQKAGDSGNSSSSIIAAAKKSRVGNIKEEESEGGGEDEDEDEEESEVKPKTKVKTTKTKATSTRATSTRGKKAEGTTATDGDEAAMAIGQPLALRTQGLKMFVGAHTSVAKGVENAITNSVHIGGNAFACFLKSQRKWENPPLKEENRDAFRKGLITHKYDGNKHIVPHGSYLVNLASADKEMANKSYKAFVDDLNRCDALGIKHYNFHPGSAGQNGTLAEAIERLAGQLNRALAETTTVVPLLENMATRGTIIGGKFEDLRDIIALIKPEFKHRIGICIDTCHAFASGYDLRTPATFKQTLTDLDRIVGLQYVKALHVNDSKAPFASHRDLHQNIGLGFLGLRAFHNVINESRFHDLPLILETPCERQQPDPKNPGKTKSVEDRRVWADEIKLLESLIGMDPDSDDFVRLEKELSDKGKAERAKMQKQFEEKQAKELKKQAKDKTQKNLKDMFKK